MDPILFVRCDPVDTFGVAERAVRDAGSAVTVWQAYEGEPRPSLDGIGGVVLFGSTFNVEHAEEQPFIKEARELTLRSLDRGIPCMGVCFGAQLLAWTLDAEVGRAPAREVGYAPIRPTPAAAGDALVSHYRDGDPVFQWHMDTFELPDGAELLATGDAVRNQAYRVGDLAWGIQFHLEIDRAELEMWLDVFSEQADLESTWGKSAAAVRAEADAHQSGHELRGREVFARFAALTRGSDRWLAS